MILCGVVALAAPLAVMSPTAAAARVHTIVIDKMAFGPAPSGLRVGDVVLWVNRDMFRHTATARDKSFDVDLAAGASARTVVQSAGTFKYFCRYHPGMIGQMVVAR